MIKSLACVFFAVIGPQHWAWSHVIILDNIITVTMEMTVKIKLISSSPL